MKRGGRMVQSGTREPLLRETERDAVNNLLKYLEHDETVTYQSLSDDNLQSLSTLAYSDNVDLQRSAALCFSEISERLTDPVLESMLEPLIHLLLSSDVDVQKSSSLALSNLALHGANDNKASIVEAGALRPLILLLSADSTEVQCNACGCITTLATKEANKSEIVRQGAVGPLLKLTRIPDMRVQRNATGALLNLTHLESNREELVQAGAVAAFIQLLDCRDVDVQFYCAAALSNIAVNEAHRRVVVGVGDRKVLRSLITLMDSDADKVRCQACLAMRNLASDDDSQRFIVEYGGLPVLVPLLRSGDTETVTAAVAALRNLSIHKGNEGLIVQSGALLELKRLITQQEFPEIQCHAAGTLRNLAAENQFQAIVESDCLSALAEQLRDARNASDCVLSEVSAALAVLASDAMARRWIMDLYNGNFYKILIKLTDSAHSEVQYNCAGVIGHLAINEEYHATLLDGNPSAVDFLLRFMQSEEPSFVHIALWILAQFSNGAKSTRAMLRQSMLMSKVEELKNLQNSLEISQLAETAFNNLKDVPDDSYVVV